MKKISLLLVLFFLIPHSAFASWSQDAGNAQRTGYTGEEPVEPWTYKWSFNGSDSTGGVTTHTYNAANEARTVVGEGKVFIPANNQGIYAVNLATGSQIWKFNPPGIRFIAAPVYDSGFVYVGGSTGNVYKLNATTGALSGTYNAGSGSSKALLLVGNFIYIVSDDGRLHKIDSTTMTSSWIYTAGSTGATPPSYSQSRNCIIYGTDDLYVHAVNNADGTRKWRVKPSPNLPYNDPAAIAQTTNGGTPVGNQLERGYPVIADVTGIVFVRMQLPHDYLFAGPNNGLFGATNTESRTWLQQNPQYKTLYALNLDDGTEKFVPAVGYGSTEDYITGRGEGYGVMGGMPVVKQLATGKEVAYTQFRSNQSSAPDFRWSGHMGEMVLDNTTVSGLNAGDMRFIKMSNYNGYGGNSYTHIIDEESPLTMAGDSLLFAHWSASTSVKITNRADTIGLTYANPIQVSLHPPIMRAIQTISCKDTTTHYSGSCTNLNFITDGGRFYGGPGWWSYFGIADPPGWKTDLSLQDAGGSTGAGTAYSAGFTPRYTYVSDGYMIVEGNGGDIMAFTHSGTVVNPTPTPSGTQITPPLTPTPTINLGNGDANGDGVVSVVDIKAILQNWLALLTSVIDQYGDGRINAMDFVRVVKQLPSPTLTNSQTPTNTPTPNQASPTPTPNSNRSPVGFDVGTGFTDVTPRQIIRTNTDKLYVFGGQAESSNVLKAYWTNGTGLPSGTTSFNGSAQVSDANAIIQTDVVYDGSNTIHVLVNTQGGNAKDYPFDITTNTFKTGKTVASGNPTVSGNYLGSGGISGMYDKTGTLHIAYWSTGNHISYKSYTYNTSTDVLTQTAGPTQIDTAGSSNHPHLVISPSDNSVTVSWVSEATNPAKILARSKPATGNFGSIENVSTGNVWISTNAGINIDQGPNMVIDTVGKKHLVYMENFDTTGDYGHVHYVTNAGTGWTDTAIPNYYTHDPAIAINSSGELYSFGHGHLNNDACKNSLDMCFKKINSSTSFGVTTLFKTSDATGGYDASPSIKWSVVGWNRPETVEMLWFRTNGGSYQNTTIMYGRY